MKNENYHSSVTANISPDEAFKGICKVSEWWGHIEGKTEKLHDVFTYRPNDTWVTFKITECIPGKKIVWYATDCYLPWLKDKTEWRDTDVVFEIEEKGDATQINFTHVGLVPEVECYNGCVKGWDKYFKDSLLKLLTSEEKQPA